MEIEVFELTETGYQSAMVIDSFSTLMIDKRYAAASDFRLDVSAISENIKYLTPDNCLLIEGCFYIIDNVSYEGRENLLFVEGISLFGLTRQRIVFENYTKYASPAVIAEDLLNRHVINPTDVNRKLSLLSLVPSSLGLDSIQYQNSYGSVDEEVKTLCDTYGFGFKEAASDPLEPSCQVTFYKGTDKSNIIEFSIENEMMLTETYAANNYDESTTAIVAGEGEGSERTVITLNGSLSGIRRKELYVDARDLQSVNDEVTLTPAEYSEALTTRGNSKLAEKQAVLLLDGDVNVNSELYKYGVDYDLGDTVSIYSKRFNVSTTATLTEMQETWDSRGHFLTPLFGKRTVTIIDYIKRK